MWGVAVIKKWKNGFNTIILWLKHNKFALFHKNSKITILMIKQLKKVKFPKIKFI